MVYSKNSLGRALALALAWSFALQAQLPRQFWAWWSHPLVVRELKLTPDQQRQIRTTVQQYRGHLIELRAEIERAESDLETQFNQQPVDVRRANEAIGRLAGARGDLTRSLSEMSLKLRVLLTQQQWEELQKRRPVKGGADQPPETPSSK